MGSGVHFIWCGLFVFVILAFVVSRFIFWRRCGWRGPYMDRRLPDSINILQRRLASGEIDQDEYKRLFDILSKQ